MTQPLPEHERGPGEFYPPVGVGPHPLPWPTDSRYDQELLREGDRRNVLDEFRYWTVDAIKAALDSRRHPLHIAIENWQHDLNIGAIVRTANAFNVAGVHIVGRKHWNQRGAMVTDRYLPMHHHPDIGTFVEWSRAEGMEIVGIDNVQGSQPIEHAALPERCIMIFGQEGPGLSDDAIAASARILHITQYGSTRSMNASAAGAIAMFAWALQHIQPED